MKLFCNIKKCDHKKPGFIRWEKIFLLRNYILPRSNLSADLFCKNVINYLRISRLLFAFFSFFLVSITDFWLSLTQQTQTSLRRLQEVLERSRRLEKDVWFKTSWRRPIYVVLKTSNIRRLQDVWFTTSWGRSISNVLKTFKLRLL